jgi:glucokinase
MSAYVLGGDIGGTKTELAIFEVRAADGIERVKEQRFLSQEHGGLEEIVEAFLRSWDGCVDAAAFGIAGPVLDQVVEVTNLPWRVERQSLAQLLGTPKVHLMNDLAATAYGALFLPDRDIQILNQGKPRRASCAVIAAGTGLGQALLMWDGKRYLACATEGGHADFASRSPVEIELLQYLLTKFDRVSVERALSGPGLKNVFDFVDQVLNVEVAAETRRRLESEDDGKVIGEHGLAGTCAACSRALDLFVEIYGAQAGNLALTAMALGGVYVGGGPAVKLLPRLRQGAFMRAFTAKGRFEELMHEIPVRVILNPQTCQLGAAHAAAELLQGA